MVKDIFDFFLYSNYTVSGKHIQAKTRRMHNSIVIECVLNEHEKGFYTYYIDKNHNSKESCYCYNKEKQLILIKELSNSSNFLNSFQSSKLSMISAILFELIVFEIGL